MSRSRRLGVREALVAGEVIAGDVSISDGRVESVGLPVGEAPHGTAVPAFVDWQVNGFGGVQFVEADAAAMAGAATQLGRHGIVYAAPTFYSSSVERYSAALGELGALLSNDPDCGLTGAHLEGPFLSPRFAGAHDPSNFMEPDPQLLRELCAAGPVAGVTLAPELVGAGALIEAAIAAGILVCVGHTDATAAQCRAAADSGALVLTHCWNAHRRFTPRDPGPAGWALTDPRVSVGLIADGIHVAPDVLAMTFAAAAGRVALTTDAIAATGTDAMLWPAPDPDGAESLAGVPVVYIDGGAARLADGTLAGSVATPSDMLRVLARAGVDFGEAVTALHRPQSAALGLPQWCLRPGDPAHVVVLDDEHNVMAVWRHGSLLTQ